MKKLLKNISLKIIILTGFILVIFIFAGIGINQYNTLSKIEKIRESHGVFMKAKFQFMSIKNLATNDIRLIYKLKLANNNEDINKIINEHDKIDANFNEIIKNISLDKEDVVFTEEEEIVFAQQLRDTIMRYDRLYNKKIKTSFEEIVRYKKLLVNPNQIREEHKTLLDEQTKLKKDYKKYEIDTLGITEDRIVNDLIKLYDKEVDSYTSDVEKSFNLLTVSITKLSVGFDKILGAGLIKLSELGESSINISWFIFIIGVIISVLVGGTISQMLINPITELQRLTVRLSKGELPKHDFIISENEIGDMNLALKDLLDGLKLTSKFAVEIGKGNFEHKYTPLGGKDALGNSLLDMRGSLQTAQTEEKKRQMEDQRRNWTTEGLAKFSEILRHHPENLKELSDEIITELVKYVNANQGGVFILNDIDKNDVYLELLAAYAYNRKKYISKKIRIGEGLVGAVALEKFTVYMTDVPNEYIEIESGTGSSNPNSILIVPLKIDEEVLGVIELASFSQFQKHEGELVEQIAESIASTLATARINTQTAELLEKSQQQANDMQLQEEEMKATIDQLQEAQSESIENEESLQGTLKKLQIARVELEQKEEKQTKEIRGLKKKHQKDVEKIKKQDEFSKRILQSLTSGVIIFDKQGTVKFINKRTEQIWQYKENEVIGRNIKLLFVLPDDFKTVSKYFNEKIKTDGTEHPVFRIIRKDNKKREYVINIVENKTDEDDINFTMFVRNLTREEESEKVKSEIMENLMANEFENTLKIEYLEDKLLENDIYVDNKNFMPEELIKWNDSYSIGLSIIDMQHKKWIDLINKLYKSLKDGEAEDSFNETYKKLIEYTEYHFGFEEKYMADTKFYDIDKHKKIHSDFVNKIKEYHESHKKGKVDVTYSLLLYLRPWVKEHITVHDIKYVEEFKKHGLS